MGKNNGRILLLLVAILWAITLPGRAATYRHIVFSQYTWDGKQGFFLDFENESQGSALCTLKELKLAFGVADGRSWRFMTASPAWKLDKDYSVKAVIGPSSSELWLDGSLVSKTQISLNPWTERAIANGRPSYGGASAEYLVVQESLKVSLPSGLIVEAAYGRGEGTGALSLFSPGGVPKEVDGVELTKGQGLMIESTFRIVAIPTAASIAPFVDKYGQMRYIDWPGKVRTDADLRSAINEETAKAKAWGDTKGFDKFGGSLTAGWKEKGTGFFRTVKRNDFWWLISPDGNPCFYTGVSTAPSLYGDKTPVSGRENAFEELPPYGTAWSTDVWGENSGTEYAGFSTWNLMRKYGDQWESRASQVTAQRLKAWGFSGIGKWGGMDGVPSLPVLGHWGVPNLIDHPDVFDPDVKVQFKEALRGQILPRLKDPFIIGWSVGNEHDEIITRDEIRKMLQDTTGSPSKRALISKALSDLYSGSIDQLSKAWKVKTSRQEDLLTRAINNAPSADIDTLRRFYAEAYYDFIYKAIKGIDPNHLYFGFWIVAGWWEEDEDWNLIARHCDIIGYDRYSPTFTDSWMSGLMAGTDKPVLLGEFSFAPTYGGSRAFGTYPLSSAKDDAEAGRFYTDWVAQATANPLVVGMFWFEYRDQPITGRGPGQGPDAVYGEHFAFGLVDGTDRPKWDLVEAMRQANLGATKARLTATGMK